jgi:hypothetical protein
MNDQVTQLIDLVRSRDTNEQQEALLRLWMLLERNFGPNRKDPIHKDLLPPNLVSLKLDEAELSEIISAIGSLLFSEDISLSNRASAVNIISRFGGFKCLELAVRFLCQYAARLDDESAAAVVIAINLPSFDLSQAGNLVSKYEIADTLEQLLARNNEILRPPVTMALQWLKG